MTLSSLLGADVLLFAAIGLLGGALAALGYVLFAQRPMAVGVHALHPGLQFRNSLDAAGAAHGGM